ERIARLREKLSIAPGDRVISTVGHVRRIKGFDVLIRAAIAVHQKDPQALFLIAGENHEPKHYAELEALLAETGNKARVRLVGNVDDVPAFLGLSDIFCLPSRSEGLSNALLEAMACGLPSVATRVGGNPELIEDGRNGYLVESEDSGRMA